MMRSYRTVLMVAVLVSLARMSGVQAQDDVLVEIRFAGLGQVEPTAKDAAAYRAVLMLGDRLAELPAEFGGPVEAGRAIELGWEALIARSGLRIEMVDDEPPVAFSLSLSPSGDEHAAKRYLDRLHTLIEDTGGPIEADGDGFILDMPDMPVRLFNEQIDGRPSVLVISGGLAPAEVSPQQFDLPNSATAAMSGMIDLGKLFDLLRQAIQRENGNDAAAFFEENAWLFDGAPALDFAYGSDDEYAYVTTRFHESADWFDRMGTDPDIVFTPDDFAGVPRDATGLTATPISFDFIVKALDRYEKETGENVFEEIDEALGIDLRHGVLENLGPRLIAYESDRTGGGGFLSGVVLCEIRDAAALARVHSELRRKLNDAAADRARGYFKIRTWSTAGHDAYSIATPGLPIPIEVSWTILGEQLVLAVSPRGLVEAVNQIEHGRDSIVDNRDFAEAVLDLMDGRRVSSISYRDSARFAAGGYSGLNILLSGLANTVRSPAGADREPGVLIPPYAELIEGVKRVCVLTYWDDRDYVMFARTDPSTLVQVADAIGQYGGAMGIGQLTAIQAAVLIPAIAKARESANQLKSASQVRTIAMAMIQYKSENNKSPKSMQELMNAGYLPLEIQDSPYGPCSVGGPGIAMRSDLDAEQLESFNPRLIVALDRTMYFQAMGKVNVGFADGHVETMYLWDFDILLNEDINKGARQTLDL